MGGPEKNPGFTSRFIKLAGRTCASTFYKDKPPGNSPENARGHDSHGFADLEYAMCFNCALSWVYPYGVRDEPPRQTHRTHGPEDQVRVWETIATHEGSPTRCLLV